MRQPRAFGVSSNKRDGAAGNAGLILKIILFLGIREVTKRCSMDFHFPLSTAQLDAHIAAIKERQREVHQSLIQYLVDHPENAAAQRMAARAGSPAHQQIHQKERDYVRWKLSIPPALRLQQELEFWIKQEEVIVDDDDTVDWGRNLIAKMKAALRLLVDGQVAEAFRAVESLSDLHANVGPVPDGLTLDDDIWEDVRP